LLFEPLGFGGYLLPSCKLTKTFSHSLHKIVKPWNTFLFLLTNDRIASTENPNMTYRLKIGLVAIKDTWTSSFQSGI
jgi:hypothetical protein